MTDQQPAFLITTDDTLTQDDTEQLRADVQITPRPLPLGLTAGMSPSAVSIRLAEALEQLLASRAICTACAFTAHKAGTLGSGAPLNLVNVIAGGDGLCFAHVQFNDDAAVEVKTPGGIIIAPGGVR